MMVKRFFVVSFLMMIVFIVAGCTMTEKTASTISSNETLKFNQTIDIALNETAVGDCTPHWGCISSTHKAYQLANCTWTDSKKCDLGCVDDECRTPKVCTRGYKCHGLKKRGLQIESCDWIIDEDCEWGCENATCKLKPNQTAVVEEPATTTAPATTLYTLNAGTEESIEFEGENHLLSIYLLEVDRVRLNLDSKKSDWLMADNSFTSGNVNITVVDILFQPYAGGKQAISYKVGGR